MLRRDTGRASPDRRDSKGTTNARQRTSLSTWYAQRQPASGWKSPNGTWATAELRDNVKKSVTNVKHCWTTDIFSCHGLRVLGTAHGSCHRRSVGAAACGRSPPLPRRHPSLSRSTSTSTTHHLGGGATESARGYPPGHFHRLAPARGEFVISVVADVGERVAGRFQRPAGGRSFGSVPVTGPARRERSKRVRRA